MRSPGVTGAVNRRRQPPQRAEVAPTVLGDGLGDRGEGAQTVEDRSREAVCSRHLWVDMHRMQVTGQPVERGLSTVVRTFASSPASDRSLGLLERERLPRLPPKPPAPGMKDRVRGLEVLARPRARPPVRPNPCRAPRRLRASSVELGGRWQRPVNGQRLSDMQRVSPGRRRRSRQRPGQPRGQASWQRSA